MINARQRLLWASLLAGATFAAAAQTPPPAAPGAGASNRAERMEVMRDRMQQRHTERLAALKTKLQLNATQESAWTAFAASHQPPAPPAQRLDRAAIEKMSTPERLDLMQSRMAERNAAFTKRADATRAFYAQLTPAQQKTFDAETLRMGPQHSPGGPDQKRRSERGQRGPRN